MCEDMMRECRVLEDCPHRYVNVHPLPAARGRPDPLGVRGVSTCADRAEGIVNLRRGIYSREAHVGQDGGVPWLPPPPPIDFAGGPQAARFLTVTGLPRPPHWLLTHHRSATTFRGGSNMGGMKRLAAAGILSVTLAVGERKHFACPFTLPACVLSYSHS